MLPLILLIVVAVVLGVDGRLVRGPVQGEVTGLRERAAGWSARLQSPTGVTVTVVVAGAIGAVYWMRQGGDFMHGRVLLNPMFTLLLPLMTVPVTIPASWSQLRGTAGAPAARRARIRVGGAVALAAIWVATPRVGLSVPLDGPAERRHEHRPQRHRRRTSLLRHQHGHPEPGDGGGLSRLSAHAGDGRRIEEYRRQGGSSCRRPTTTTGTSRRCPTRRRRPSAKLTVYFLNLGMTGMNAPLDVRVVDQMGLAYPLAAHTERLIDGRIGHDRTCGRVGGRRGQGGVEEAGTAQLPRRGHRRRGQGGADLPGDQERYRSLKAPGRGTGSSTT